MLDEKTYQNIKEIVFKLFKDKTMIIVSYKKDIVDEMDKVIDLKH